jgi:hypothetical protein
MDRKREDLMYELQQAIARMPQSFWRHYLSARCPEDAQLCDEVVQRQAATKLHSMRAHALQTNRTATGCEVAGKGYDGGAESTSWTSNH